MKVVGHSLNRLFSRILWLLMLHVFIVKTICRGRHV
jgi:hypothetical protein